MIFANPKKHCISKVIKNAYEAKNQENFSLSSYFLKKYYQIKNIIMKLETYILVLKI